MSAAQSAAVLAAAQLRASPSGSTTAMLYSPPRKGSHTAFTPGSSASGMARVALRKGSSRVPAGALKLALRVAETSKGCCHCDLK